MRAGAACGIVFLLAAGGFAPALGDPYDPIRIQAEVDWLADGQRGGRAVGTPGLEAATDWLVARFAEIGLDPAGDAGTYRQAFQSPRSVEFPVEELTIGGEPLESGRDFMALLTSGSGSVPEDFVVAGFGIVAPELRRDDYEGLDVKGKTVIVFEGRPSQVPELPGRYGTFAQKIAAARERGAKAVLVAPAWGQGSEPPSPKGEEATRPSLSDAGIVALAISRETAVRLGRENGVDLFSIEALSGSKQPQRAGAKIGGRIRAERAMSQVANVVGRIRGTELSLAGESLIVGAHFDHIGVGEFGSGAPSQIGTVHPGADDNASGVAGLLAIARHLKQAGPLRRDVYLVGFTSEEYGTLGAKHYLRHPPSALAGVRAMLNLDMIGRLRGDRIYVSARSHHGQVVQAATTEGLNALPDNNAFGISDHTAFEDQLVPSIYIHTGSHDAYHTPSDTIVEPEGIARIARTAYRVLRSLDAMDPLPAPVEDRGESDSPRAR